MGDGALAAAFKALAVDAVRTARDIAHSAADVAEKTADIEERNLRRLLDSDARAGEAFNKIGREPAGGFTGAGHIEQSSRAAEDAYAAIRADTGDVSPIATNTGIDQAVVAQVKKHLFMTEHDVPVGSGLVRSGYFTADERIAELWSHARRGPRQPPRPRRREDSAGERHECADDPRPAAGGRLVGRGRARPSALADQTDA